MKDVTEMTEDVFLEKLECMVTLGYTGHIENETPFFIIEDLIKLRRMAKESEERTQQ